MKVPKDLNNKVNFKDFLRSIGHIFKQKGRWLYAIFAIGCISMFVIFGVLFYLSSELETVYYIKGIMKGLVLAIPLAALCLTSYFTGKLIGESKVKMKWVTVIGLFMLTGAIFCIGWTEQIYFIISGLIICGIGIGSVLPSLDALVTEGIEKEHRGTVTSIYSSMRFVGVAAGPPVISLLMNTSHKTLFFTVTGVCIVAVLLALLEIRPGKKYT